ncbi:MAG: hypothetical protein RQ801_10965 [Spirochaetaceae bacterium]|nr:hypothetical protein [Spirochaetaceae bacterium]
MKSFCLTRVVKRLKRDLRKLSEKGIEVRIIGSQSWTTKDSGGGNEECMKRWGVLS